MEKTNNCCEKCSIQKSFFNKGVKIGVGYECDSFVCPCHSTNKPKDLWKLVVGGGAGTNKPMTVESFTEELANKVRFFSGMGQYSNDHQEQKAYLDGVSTAIGMMSIDLTGTPKSKGMLDKYATQIRAEERERILDILDGMEDHTARNVVLFHLNQPNPINLNQDI